ncbi:hypothetical protein [Pseudonocardia hydrocarbonoxydans]|uniref:Uncharacterized protein n=1 Tax=Pseudonocardia hydrocarbonoxydans TaxID=76726 RepID=A0A4Y3WKA1_9PSEU|nr:hypothetical protein [Pseudonocardia hydrocarbonoxydans]GEC18671.1 hypothetical protein PHY01_09540 [Pseudonocardia hydrocarbonoxydans]
MAGFLLRRLANYVALCFIAAFATFSLASLTFNPLASYYERTPPPPAEVILAKRAELRLDDPIPLRFLGGSATSCAATSAPPSPAPTSARSSSPASG